MADYNIKNLLVTLLPEEGEPGPSDSVVTCGPRSCGPRSGQALWAVCCQLAPLLTLPQPEPPGGAPAQSPAESLVALATLKEQLRQQLDSVTAEEAAVAKTLEPKNLAEVDRLIKDLGAALEELEKIKERLEAEAKAPVSK